MKATLPMLVFAAGQLCFGAGELSIIAMSPWSQPVSLWDFGTNHLHDEAIRGRLLIIKGSEPGYAGPNRENGAMTFVELQNVTGAYVEGINLFFAVTNLHCQLSDAAGKAVPLPSAGGWGGRGPFPSCWVKLPYNSNIRLFINGGSMSPLSLYPGGEPWTYWSIPGSDTNVYYLTGTFSVSAHTNYSDPPELWERYYRATLVFPKTKITSGVRTLRNQSAR
jgi:hypothetical protein